MCYPKPGPRCSNHAGKKLATAITYFRHNPTEHNQLAMDEARAEYALTPAGIKELRASGLDEVEKGNVKQGVNLIREADENEAKRERLINASKSSTATLEFERISKALNEVDAIEVTNDYAKVDALRNIDLPAQVLDHLATESQVIQNFVASHPNTSPETLTYLSGYKSGSSVEVRCSLAENPNTPVAALIEIAARSDEATRWLVRPAILARPEAVARMLGIEDDVSSVETLLREHPSQVSSMLGWN